jgi:hypothetical protein
VAYTNDSSLRGATSHSLNGPGTFVGCHDDIINVGFGLAEQIYITPESSNSQQAIVTLDGSDTVTLYDTTASLNSVWLDGGGNVATFSTDGGGITYVPSNSGGNSLLFLGPSDDLQEGGSNNFVKQSWSNANTLIGTCAGENNTLDGGLTSTMNMNFACVGLGNNIWFAAGHTGVSAITIGGGYNNVGTPELAGYTIENVNPAYDQFNIGSLTIAGDTISAGNSLVELSNGDEMLFKGYSGSDDPLFVGYH